MCLGAVAKIVDKSKPERGEHAEEEGDLLDEDDVYAEDLLHLRDSRGKYIYSPGI